ncbi:hypothetical protein ABT297_04040 [Dactylosporangium sp. NPDC000555]|uniref:hypothetical protein n=1 Tax=Dactylosporangium sp. NPDC000555 TaxID=3154260 RepID=UPI003321BA39
MHARIEPDRRSFARVAHALDEEADGERLRRDLVAGFEEILDDVMREQKAGLMGMSSAGLPHAGEPLRTAIADRMEVQIKLSGRSAGARIVAHRRGLPRGFGNAPKRTNARSWRHRVYGRDVWVTQIGAPGWFDDPVKAHRTRYRAAARRVLVDMSQRIARGA